MLCGLARKSETNGGMERSNQTAEEKHFVDQTTKLYDFVLKADNVLDKITEYKDNWLTKLVVKFMK